MNLLGHWLTSLQHILNNIKNSDSLMMKLQGLNKEGKRRMHLLKEINQPRRKNDKIYKEKT